MRCGGPKIEEMFRQKKEGSMSKWQRQCKKIMEGDVDEIRKGFGQNEGKCR